MKRLFERPAFLLGVGAALIFVANFRWGVGVVAWIAPVLLLRYLRLTRGWRSRVTFGLALCTAWIATTLKIVTAPLPIMAALLMGLIAAIFNLAAYLAWDVVRRRSPHGAALLAFPAAVVVTEWLQHFTPLASWGAMVYTQVDNLPLLGHGPLAAVDASFGRASGAICYDYPKMALEHARLGVDVIALPSSDWRGIDPLHAQMAVLGAIAGGFSVVRSTRFGLSAIIMRLAAYAAGTPASRAGIRCSWPTFHGAICPQSMQSLVTCQCTCAWHCSSPYLC
jgi:apolipoprotein N-acyltransferase